MKISASHISKLKQLFREQFGRELSDEEAQAAGRAIMRFVIAKRDRAAITKYGDGNGRTKRSPESFL